MEFSHMLNAKDSAIQTSCDIYDQIMVIFEQTEADISVSERCWERDISTSTAGQSMVRWTFFLHHFDVPLLDTPISKSQDKEFLFLPIRHRPKTKPEPLGWRVSHLGCSIVQLL